MAVDTTPTQKLDYLPQINKSPTSAAVVHETLVRSQKIAIACNQEYVITTFDLGIAKTAVQIQITEQTFDNVFINLEAFHIEMAYFKAVEKFINGCGITDILSQAKVISDGSINGFVDGKHFNRCKSHCLRLFCNRIL